MKAFISAFLLLLTITGVHAEKTAYVTDNLSTAVRSGATNEYRIVYYLPAGSKITLMDDPAENGFVKVRDDRGREGWTLERFITESKGAIVRLDETQKQLANALKTIEQLKQTHSKEQNQLSDQLQSANAIVEASRTYQSQISELETRNVTLKQQNDRLNDRFEQEVFFAGAAVVLAGLLIGFIAGKMSGKKRGGWN